MPDDTPVSLTPAMKRVLIAVGAVVVAGLVTATWFFTSNATGGADAEASSAPSPQTAGPLPDATPTSGSEVLPPTETDANRLPTRGPIAPLIAAPLPASASGEGSLVDGFPAKVMGPTADADVVQSAIATDGGTMQVSLVARTDATKEEVSRHYAELWASLGLAPQSTGEDGALGYTSPFESLSLAFSPSSGTGTVYMVYGVFRTG